MQFIALVVIDIELSVFNGGESSKLRGRISQRAKRQRGEKRGQPDTLKTVRSAETALTV